MRQLIIDYVNGNLAYARTKARKYGHAAIRKALIERLGYTNHKAGLTADWLKGHGDWQAACDAN